MKPKVTTFDIAGMVAEAKTLNKPFRTPKGPKKFSVYVKNEKGNIVKVNFGDPNMEIKQSPQSDWEGVLDSQTGFEWIEYPSGSNINWYRYKGESQWKEFKQ